MRMEEYGLEWTARIPSNDEMQTMLKQKPVILQQGGGLMFLGNPSVNLFWGPCIIVHSMYDANKQVYKLYEDQWFFSSKLEDICLQYRMYQKLYWYHTLKDGFKFFKSAFKQQKHSNNWRMSLTTTIGSKEDANVVAELFQSIRFVTHGPKIYVTFHGQFPFLNIDGNTYNNLPSKWSITSLYAIDATYYNSTKRQNERLWYDIADARQTKRPIKIHVFDPQSREHVVYTEKIVYGIAMPNVLPYEEEIER